MTRVVAFLSLVLLAAAVSFGPSLVAPPRAVAAGTKVCKAKTPAGKLKTWRCGTDQACCVNSLTNQYVCGLPGMGCL